MRVCLWPLAEGRGDVSDSLYTGSVGFCQCSLLSRGSSSSLLAYASEEMEEVSCSQTANAQHNMLIMMRFCAMGLCEHFVCLCELFICWHMYLKYSPV